jgi:hypothetical protein
MTRTDTAQTLPNEQLSTEGQKGVKISLPGQVKVSANRQKALWKTHRRKAQAGGSRVVIARH